MGFDHGSAFRQHLTAKSFGVFNYMTSVCENKPVHQSHVVASHTTEITEQVVLDRHSVAALLCEAVVQLLRLKGRIAVTCANPAIQHDWCCPVLPFRANFSPWCLAVQCDAHLKRLY